MRPLPGPTRPLPTGGTTWAWRWQTPTAGRPWSWCRVYHRDAAQTPTGDTPRGYGPLARFDPHTRPPDAPGVDPTGRSVLYVGADLATAASEVFGVAGEALLCDRWRVCLLRPTRRLVLFDLTAPGAAMAIGALPSLADGFHPRALTQRWARAIYEDNPTGFHVDGIRYRSAYNSGLALALWDSRGHLAVPADSAGRAQDFALTHPAVLNRLTTAMTDRRITVTIAAAGRCPRCRAATQPGTSPTAPGRPAGSSTGSRRPLP